MKKKIKNLYFFSFIFIFKISTSKNKYYCLKSMNEIITNYDIKKDQDI